MSTLLTPAHRPLRRHSGRAKIIPATEAEMLPYQARYAYDNSRLKLWLKSRQIGGSTTSQKALVDRISADSAMTDAFISSSNETQARLYMEGCCAYTQRINIPAETEGKIIIDEDGHTAYVLRFANGRRIFSMSSSINAQAGKSGDRILDEFATHPHARELYGIAVPGTMWGGSRLEIISTQRGRDTYFNELVEEIQHGGNPKKFSFHKVTLQDALDQGLLHKLQLHSPEEDVIQEMDEADYFNYVRNQCPDEEFFQQEYMCVASDIRTAFLPHDLIASCEYAPGEKWELTEAMTTNSQNDWFAGMDVAREKDLSVIWLVEKMGDVYHTRWIETMEKESFDAQEQALDIILQFDRVRRVCIDNTGIGRQFAERAFKRYGKWRIEPVTFTAEVKEQLAYPLRTAFEKRTVRVPNDNLIRSDLRSVRKEMTASGNIRFSAGRSENGHADRFWALALALHAGGTYRGTPGAYVA
jgi:phage FluMu gp28-like protein